MTKIVWDQAGQRFYESGVSQGVFYGEDGSGVPWNGLISVDTKSVDELDPLHFDGVKYSDLVTLGDFEGTLKAYTYPDEFLEYEGIWDAQPGVHLMNQPKARFGLSYRTEIGNENGQSIGYKIHILYNLIAIQADRSYETLSLDTDPTELEWDISAIPEDVDNFRPTAYLMLDSRKIDPFLLSDIEDILYGGDEADARLPDLSALVQMVLKWGRLIITLNPDGTWTATSPIDGVITMTSDTEFEITTDTATYLDAETYTISSSDKVEVD